MRQIHDNLEVVSWVKQKLDTIIMSVSLLAKKKKKKEI